VALTLVLLVNHHLAAALVAFVVGQLLLSGFEWLRRRSRPQDNQ
jgi:hypothetical protein